MSAIYIMILLVLMGTDILPSEVHAGSSKNSDSRDSKGKDATYCKSALPYKQKVEDKIKYCNEKKQPLPTCKCGTSGTISKIDTLDSSGKTTSLVTCSGCTGSQIPVQSDAECCNIADTFRPDLDKFCQTVRLRCKNFTVYRCGCPAASTTQTRTTPLATQSSTTPLTTQSSTTPLTTQSSTAPLSSATAINDAPTTGASTSLPTTGVPSTTVTAGAITIEITPILDPHYKPPIYDTTI